MSSSLGVEVIQNAVFLSLTLAAPLLLVALLVGLVVSLVQALTQLQEQTLTFIPKILAVSLTLVVALPWMLSRLTEYLVGVIRSLPAVAG